MNNGYDILDYRATWPTFGTMEDIGVLIREAKQRGMQAHAADVKDVTRRILNNLLGITDGGIDSDVRGPDR